MNWTDVVPLAEIADHKGVVQYVNGTALAIMRDGDEAFALGNTCAHRGGHLGDGWVANGRVICPLHYWDFDLRTGISPYDPQHDAVPTYPCRVTDGMVQVDADAVPAFPPLPDEYLTEWRRRGAGDRGMDQVTHLAQGDFHDLSAMGSLRLNRPREDAPRMAILDQITFRPAQVARLPLLGDVPVDTSVTLGARAGTPLRLDIPVFVSHMSFGALSAEAKEALAKGASAAGTAIASGEGGALPAERDNANAYIFEMASGYFGWTEDNIRAANAIEVKGGQGAKPGLGGTLPGTKVTAEIAAVRGVAPGTTVHSPAHFPDINSVADLRARVDEIRGITDVPIGIKFAAGDVEADVAAALEAGADWITVDGLGGGTGAAPDHVKDHTGMPSIIALARARDFMQREGVEDVQLICTGGFRTPDEVGKALAMGADAVALASASLIAAGCQQYRACGSDACPVGIATQDPRLRARLDVATSAKRVEMFLKSTTSLLVDYARLCGRHATAHLCVDDLLAQDPDLARRLGIPSALPG